MPAFAPQAASDAGPPTSSDPLPPHRPWLHAYAVLLTVATFLLVAIGGNVTSKGAGLAVPDWPTTFGYNMFLAPLHVWWEQSDRFWEHFHRLMGSLVGVLTIGMAIWLAVTQWRGRRWLAWLGFALLALVSAQGVMGGLRVTELSIELAIVHGITGQLILGITVFIAAATSAMWRQYTHHSDTPHSEPGRPRPGGPEHPAAAHALDGSSQVTGPGTGRLAAGRGLRRLVIGLVAVLVVQLVLGAMVRHTGASLAIPDFPTAYGGWVPPMDQAALDAAVAAHPRAVRPYTVGDVALHFSHRMGAGVILLLAIWMILWLNVRVPAARPTKWPARWLMLLLGAQIAAGASVVWSGRYPEIATLHQALGAALLAVATWLAIRVHLLDYAARHGQGKGESAWPLKETPALGDDGGDNGAGDGKPGPVMKEQPA